MPLVARVKRRAASIHLPAEKAHSEKLALGVEYSAFCASGHIHPSSFVRRSTNEKGDETMATQTSVSPGFAEEVHVTGRRILAIIVDSLLIGLVLSPFTLFGTNTDGSMSTYQSVSQGLNYLVVFLLYFTLLEGYLGQTVGKMLL